MNLYVTVSAVRVLRILVMRWTSRFVGPDAMVDAVARQTQLIHCAELQQSRIRRAMRRMTSNAPISLDRRMFIGEWALFVGVTLYARCIGAGG